MKQFPKKLCGRADLLPKCSKPLTDERLLLLYKSRTKQERLKKEKKE